MSANGFLPKSSLTDVGGGQLLRPDVAGQWLAMVDDCLAATGARLTLTEGYRSFARQVFFWARWLTFRKIVAARPGTSNHGWGTAVDLGGFEPDRVWAWLNARAPDYGFTWTQGRASGERWHWVFAVTPTISPSARAGKRALPDIGDIEMTHVLVPTIDGAVWLLNTENGRRHHLSPEQLDIYVRTIKRGNDRDRMGEDPLVESQLDQFAEIVGFVAESYKPVTDALGWINEGAGNPQSLAAIRGAIQ
jgi:hypothetical protein